MSDFTTILSQKEIAQGRALLADPARMKAIATELRDMARDGVRTPVGTVLPAPAHSARYTQLAEEWNNAAAVHNHGVRQQRAASKRRRTAAANRREVAAVRAARCGSCFTVHAGECA